MKNRVFSSFMLMVFLLFAVIPVFGGGTVQADTISDVVDEMASIYEYLDDDEKSSIRTARTALQDLADNPASSDWDAIINPLMTDEVKGKFNTEAEARQALIDFAAGVGDIYYSTEKASLNNTLTQFKNDYNSTFSTLFEDDVTMDDFYSFLLETKNQMRSVASGYIDELAYGDKATLVDTIATVTIDAMEEALNNPDFQNFRGKLAAIGWSTESLNDQQKLLAAEIDPNNDAQVALAMAAVRSEATYTGEVTFDIGDHPEYTVSLLGGNASNLLDWHSSNENVVSIAESQAATRCLIKQWEPELQH